MQNWSSWSIAQNEELEVQDYMPSFPYWSPVIYEGINEIINENWKGEEKTKT